MWFEGPRFLWLQKVSWEPIGNFLNVKPDDPELKAISCNYVETSTDLLSYLEQRTSKWNKMRKILSWVIFFGNKLKDRCWHKTKKALNTSPDLDDFQKAEKLLIQAAQARSFADELKNLNTSKERSSLLRQASIED